MSGGGGGRGAGGGVGGEGGGGPGGGAGDGTGVDQMPLMYDGTWIAVHVSINDAACCRLERTDTGGSARASVPTSTAYMRR